MDLGKYLAQAAGPKMGPQRETSQYIDIDCLVADDRNFYELSGIDALAANIELVGLQQPIRVREISGEGKYRIVSGHRRRAAIQKLVDEGREDLRSVHCIVETVECSEAMQELRLIWANKDTREMTSAEKAREAEKAKEVLLRLKDEGFVFEGRLRDHVALLVGESKSKLSRLKVIREKLHPKFLAEWESGKINDSVAYCIAQEDARVQEQLFSNTGFAARHWTANAAEAAINRVKHPPVSKPVSSGGFNAQKTANDYLEQRAAEDMTFTQFIQKHGFGYFLKHAAGITRKSGIDEMKNRIGFAHFHHSGGEGDRWEAMPNGLTIKPVGESFRRSWVEVWDAMAVEALRRCRLNQINAEKPQKPEPKEPETKPRDKNYRVGWYPNKIRPEDGQRIVFIDKDGIADNDVYQAGTLKSGKMFGNTWDDVVMWTPEPEALSPDEEDI